MGKRLKLSRKKPRARTRKKKRNCIHVNGGKLLLVTRADTYNSSALPRELFDCLSDSYSDKNHNFIISDEEISVETRSESYCVCMVDMADSTRITSRIRDPKRIMRYYSIFLNSMAAIARGYGAKIIKNVGDSLIYYFPETADVTKWSGFKGALESAITMIWAHKVINAKLSEEKLPLVDYRISADYGRVEIAKSSSSMSEDLFGSTVNMCSKINTKAPPNGLIIRDDLYRVLKGSFSDISNAYSFRKKGEYSLELNISYPLYEMKSKLDLIPNLVDPLHPINLQTCFHQIVLIS